jgi:ATP-binding cassette, subfamily B, bacterial MsbA
MRSTGYLLKRLAKYLVPLWPVLALGLMINVFYSGIDAGFTYMAKLFVDRGLVAHDQTFIAWIPWIILVGITTRGIMNALAGYMMTWVARQLVNVLRRQVFNHFMQLPAQLYHRYSSGQLLSKILYDVEQVAHVSADALTTFVQSICLIIGLLAVMFYISWQLSLLFMLTAPVVVLIVNYTNKRTRRVSHAAQQSMGQVTEIAEEAIKGYQEVRIYGGQAYETNKFTQATEQSRLRDMKVAAVKAFNVAGVQTVIACGIALIVVMAIQLSATIAISAGGFVAIIVAMLQLSVPIKRLTNITSIIQRGLAGAESIFNLLDEPGEEERGQRQLTQVRGELCFEHLHFAYPDRPVLHDIQFTMQPGETVALVGRSGSGKSTLASLVPRFYVLEQGRILLDDVDISQLSLTNLRKHIALVSQHVVLFNDTITNNISYGSTVDRQRIEQVARQAHVWEFVQELPQGLDTMIGENGVLLSGGQRQRIAIARALMKDAPILILDEATSALDTESERHIQAALTEVMRNRTTLVIAHRLSTVENADRILVLDNGCIIEQGSHRQLLAQNGHYAYLYKMQFQSAAPKSDEMAMVG